MKTFLLFLESDEIRRHKGWMGPTGKVHLFNDAEHHSTNYHPDYKPRANAKGVTKYVNAMKQGFARFGHHAGHAYLQYDGSSPKGQSAAVHALNYVRHTEPSHYTICTSPLTSTPDGSDFTTKTHPEAVRVVKKAAQAH